MSSGLTKQDMKIIIQVLKEYPEVEIAVLYGSRALGTYQRGSDIDIALKGKMLTDSICSHIHFKLEEETLLPYFFDITDYQSIKNDKLKEHIDRVGKVIYEIDENRWQIFFLDEVIEIVGGGTPKTIIDEYWSGDIPWLSVVDFGNDNRWVSKTEKSITEKGLRNSSTKLLNKGDLIISARGTVGEIAQLSKPMAFNQSCYGLKAKPPLSNEFLYYLLKYNILKLKRNTHGSVFSTITRDTFKNIDIKYPDSESERYSIEKTLSCLDLKINNLQRQNQIFEKIAQTLFKQWFVDFNFPCLPENYKFSGAGKPMPSYGAGKPAFLELNPGAGKPMPSYGAGKPGDFESVMTYQRVGGLPVPDGKSTFVYVLLCEDGSFYKGITNDLYYRFYQHFVGQGADWTKSHKPKSVIHWERFDSKVDAAKREKELKTGYGRTWLQRQYKKLLKGLPAPQEGNGLPAPQEGNGLPAPGFPPRKAGLPAPESHFRKAGSPAPESHSRKAGSPAPECQLRKAGEMVGTELGKIPKEWRVGTLREISEKISKGTTPRKKDVEGLLKEIPFLKVKDITNGGLIKLDTLENIPREIHNNALNRSKLETNDILFSIAGTIGRVAIVTEVLNNSNCNQAIAFIRLASKDFYLEYVHQWIKSRAVHFEIKSNIVQGVQANVSLTVLWGLQIVLPVEYIMNSWNNFIKPIYQKLENNNLQIQTLTKIRDTLLPKLMSGQIRVSD